MKTLIIYLYEPGDRVKILEEGKFFGKTGKVLRVDSMFDSNYEQDVVVSLDEPKFTDITINSNELEPLKEQ